MMRLYWINFLCDSIKANRLITTRILYLWAIWLLSKERMEQNGITMILMDGPRSKKNILNCICKPPVSKRLVVFLVILKTDILNIS